MRRTALALLLFLAITQNGRSQIDNAIGWISEGQRLELSGIVARMLRRNLSREAIEQAVREAAGSSRLDNHSRDWKMIIPLFGWEFSFFDQAIGQGLGELDAEGQARLKKAYLAALGDAPFIRALLSGLSPALFPIMVEGKWGYVDDKGNVILSPRYRAAGSFAEGLAPVRSRGTYGYIGPGGQFTIEPRFDYAEPFEDGIARVYLEGKPYFINRFGQILFEHPFEEIEAFGPHSYAIVKAVSGKYGLINREGQLLADTVFWSIMPFSDGRTVVQGPGHNPYPGLGEEAVWEVGAIDTSGVFAVPFGLYRDISYFNNGLAIVELSPEEKYKQGVIDANGNLKFTIPEKEWKLNYRIKTFSEGLADVKIYLIDPDSLRTWPRPERVSYVGAVNTNGQVVFSNQDWEELTLFGQGRAFAKDIGGFWIMIDKQGRQVGADTYEYIIYSNWAAEPQELFEDGIFFVKTREGWCSIDTSGAVVAGPLKYDNERGSAVRQGKRLLFFRRDTSTRNGYLFGFWDPEKGVLVEPQFHEITTLPPHEDVLLAMESGRYGYIGKQGRYLWREPPRDSNAALLPLDIDYMNLGLYPASLPSRKDPDGREGMNSTRNVFQETTDSQGFQNGTMTLVARLQERGPWNETYEGFQLYLANTTQDTVFFEAPYGCLYLKIQALDKSGEWRDIEYLPDSWCSYTYGTAFLPPGHFWAFTAPKYSGEYSTRLRAELQYWDSFEEEKPKILHSNEFRSGVNPAQFWRKRPLTPEWRMNPYKN
ncbi:MAG: WG repeat-containing protein [Lewinellaceae bacterium]|nr:WG repeat-containing protein [Lewinellaceae bacterium]MCB9296799.1 WG repeat-containing protein [Lewinellaceae bacterium]